MYVCGYSIVHAFYDVAYVYIPTQRYEYVPNPYAVPDNPAYIKF